MRFNVPMLLSQMTLEEKAGLCSGEDFWHTKAIERLGIPAIMVSDGPHGLRTQFPNTSDPERLESIEAVCFPSGAAIAASFDRTVAARLGDALGKEALAVGVHTLLGPAVNMKRSPLCGRNFEYFSEDPYLAGELAAAYIQAVQQNGVGTSIKHFAANNQEYCRMSASSQVSERALREIYLPAFETAVKKAQPWTVMCSYNRLNGVYACENKWLLTDVLRGEWGFQGIAMTDWGAMNRRCKALLAGLNLEMPSSNGENDKLIVEAVKNGTLDEKDLDRAVTELLMWIDRALEGAERVGRKDFSREADHRLAHELETECAVLLKNEEILPLRPECKVAFVGGFAAAPRYQGGGSSHVRSSRVISALGAAADRNVIYAEGFPANGDQSDEGMFEQAVEAACQADVCVVFAGLPDSYESEGYDRSHLELPACQNELIQRIAQVQPNTVVVLHNGSPVRMPWHKQVKGILELYLGGQAVGSATVDLLYGRANPSGHLAETFPNRLEDTPCYLDFPGNGEEISYAEGIFVGYRWYDTRAIDVLFPFGHGLSYTQFEYSGLSVTAAADGNAAYCVRVKVKNVGSTAGKAVAQLYIQPPCGGAVHRPVRELKGFEKVLLQPGESKELTFMLNRRSFAYYERRTKSWFVESGAYTIWVGNSSRDLPVSQVLQVEHGDKMPLHVCDYTTCQEVLQRAKDPSEFLKLLKRCDIGGGTAMEDMGSGSAKMMTRMQRGLPLHALVSFCDVTMEQLQELIKNLKEQEEM